MRWICHLAIIFSNLTCFSQESSHNLMSGKVISSKTNQPIPYATIHALQSNTYTKTNEKGEFKIALTHQEDSLMISYLGYQKRKYWVSAKERFKVITLETQSNKINEIRIKPTDYNQLFELVDKCHKSRPHPKKIAKAHFELRDSILGEQTGLIESYYNLDLEGYELKEMHLKAGRLGLKIAANKSRFSTQGISTAILQFDPFKKITENYPSSPLHFSSKRRKKKYYFHLEDAFRTAEGDSICIIHIQLKDTNETHFEGIFYINESKLQFEKINLYKDNTSKHPLVPIVKYDQINGINFNLTYTYKNINDTPLFHQLDYRYEVDYSRNKSPFLGRTEDRFIISTSAIVFAYDYTQKFDLPKIDLKSLFYSKDYSLINAYPYNRFFWNNHSEKKIDANAEYNSRFFEDTSVMTNRYLFQPSVMNRMKNTTIFWEFPFRAWSPTRLLVRPDRQVLSGSADTSNSKNNQNASEVFLYGQRKSLDPYQFTVHFFMDQNLYKDTLNILSSIIFDPNESFYGLNLDHKSLCFLNIYFDIAEIVRREFAEKVETSQNIRSLYDAYQRKMKIMLNEYLNDVDETKSMIHSLRYQTKWNELPIRDKNLFYWNNYVIKYLGIDNLKFFNLKFENDQIIDLDALETKKNEY